MSSYFFIIGFMCNGLGCYWVPDETATTPYSTIEQCRSAVRELPRPPGYFQLACMLRRRFLREVE
jgi:hypothetical protein